MRISQGGHEYEYGAVATRSPAEFRDVESARRCLAVVEALEMPCGGHKSPPLIARWPGFDWYRMSPPELMHDSKIFLEMLLKVLVGKVSGNGFYGGWSYDNKHRKEAELSGIFESIWPCNNGALPWRLTAAQRKLLDARMAKLIWPQYIEKHHNAPIFGTSRNTWFRAVHTIVYRVIHTKAVYMISKRVIQT